ncbi:MAG: transmembrane glycosyltransferase [Bacteroidetes bacterium HGW-Bacteroidetes-21]|jgi:cellulose synthase/poly-beta-1,6-N-acetylglucosamine synthase-like glycosyltransferase|nr:MAG: transmembrane glycosyltransferase [Bacteroidetes bacterium HGW-Bacteroidetes-21]
MFELYGYTFSLAALIVLSGLLFVFLIQLFYYLYFYGRIMFYREKPAGASRPEPISVVICARNEEVHLPKHLPAILQQKYPNYEVVVVNDCSEDESGEILKKFAEEYPHFRFTTIKKDEKFSHGKKLAITVGIKSAKNNTLLFTDADCMPLSDNWLSEMVTPLQNKNEICLGYSGFFKQKGFLNLLIRYDAFFIAMHYFSFAMAGIPYMGVGRNLAYKKEIFYRSKGFVRHLDLDSGDDDLLINENAHKGNTVIKLNPEAQTRTYAPTSFARWMRQKTRHRTTFPRYKIKHRFWLAVEPLTRFAFYPLLITWFFLSPYYYIALIIYGLRLSLQLIVNYLWGKRLNEKDLFLFSPLTDILSIFIGMYLVNKTLFSRTRPSWK